MTKIPRRSPLLSKGEELRDIAHIMSIGNLILGVNSVTVSYLIHYDSLLQNATAILLQNATEVYYKMHRVFYYKMQQLLQIATILLQNVTFVTNCDSKPTNTCLLICYYILA